MNATPERSDGAISGSAPSEVDSDVSTDVTATLDSSVLATVACRRVSND